jgi:hypothetical protein
VPGARSSKVEPVTTRCLWPTSSTGGPSAIKLGYRMSRHLFALIAATVGLSSLGLPSAARADIAPSNPPPPPTKAQRASVYVPFAVHFARTTNKRRGFGTADSELHIPRAVLVDLLRGRKDGDAKRRRPRVTRGAVTAMAGRVKVTRGWGKTIVQVSPAQMAAACKAFKKRKRGVKVLPERAKRNVTMAWVRVRDKKAVSVDIPLSVLNWLAKRSGGKAGAKTGREGKRKGAALAPISGLGGGPGAPGWPRVLGLVGLLALIALGAMLTLRRRRSVGLGLVVLALAGLAVLTTRVSESDAWGGTYTDIRITDAKDRVVRLYARPNLTCKKGG